MGRAIVECFYAFALAVHAFAYGMQGTCPACVMLWLHALLWRVGILPAVVFKLCGDHTGL
jgi:hypothetical protein